MGTTGAQGQDGTARAAVDVRTLLLVLAVAAALLMAYFVGGVRDDGGPATASADTAAAAEEAATDPATMVMTGTGKATGVPDQLTFRVGVRATASDVSSALAQANNTQRKVLHTVRREGVAPKDVKTTGLSIRPVYDYSSDGPAVISGYAAAESVAIAVKDLATSGQVLGATADTGGNAIRISGISLGISDKDAPMSRARADAVAEATTKAQEYADATGRQLGQVVSVREVMPGTTVPPVAETSALASRDLSAASVVPIRTGRSPLQVTVAVVWTFAG